MREAERPGVSARLDTKRAGVCVGVRMGGEPRVGDFVWLLVSSDGGCGSGHDGEGDWRVEDSGGGGGGCGGGGGGGGVDGGGDEGRGAAAWASCCCTVGSSATGLASTIPIPSSRGSSTTEGRPAPNGVGCGAASSSKRGSKRIV